MKLYYIIRQDGSSVFQQGFPLDFISHCYYNLSERSDETLRVVFFDESLPFCVVQTDRGKGDESPLLAFSDTENILKYIFK